MTKHTLTRMMTQGVPQAVHQDNPKLVNSLVAGGADIDGFTDVRDINTWLEFSTYDCKILLWLAAALSAFNRTHIIQDSDAVCLFDTCMPRSPSHYCVTSTMFAPICQTLAAKWFSA